MNRLFQKSWFKQVSLIVFASLILLLGWNLLNDYTNSPAIAQDNDSSRILTVEGDGTTAIETTLTEVQLGVEVEKETAQQAQQWVAEQSTAVVELLRDREVDNLQTTGIRLQPQYNYINDERRLQGYKASNLVSFRLKTDDIGDLLDQAVSAGATRIDSVNFTATDSAIAQAKKDALQSATLDAQEKAEAVLETLNLTSQSVNQIRIDKANSNSIRQNHRFMQAQAADAEAKANSPVIGGKQEVEATVNLEISY